MKDDDLFFTEEEPEEPSSPQKPSDQTSDHSPYGEDGRVKGFQDEAKEKTNNDNPYDIYRTNPYHYDPQAVPPIPESNGLAVVSLVMGILSLVCCVTVYPPIIFAITGIITGALSKKGKPLSGMALCGIVLSIIALVLLLVLIAITVATMLNNPQAFEEIRRQVDEMMRQSSGAPTASATFLFFRA